MATPMHISRPSIFNPPETTHGHHNRYGPHTISLHKKKPLTVSFASLSSEQSSSELKKPEIDLEFIGPKVGNDGSYPVDRASAVSGEKLLRSIMADNKIELYATYGKVMNCGGVGNCGTCIVEIVDGHDLLNERTNAELRYFKRNLNLGGSLAKQLLEIKRILGRL